MIKKLLIAVTGFLLFISAFYYLIGTLESQAVQPVAERLQVAPNRATLREYATALLESKVGASREEIHQVVAQLEGEVSIVDQSTGRRQSDRIRWIMGDALWGPVSELWVLEYDDDGRLVEIHVGS